MNRFLIKTASTSQQRHVLSSSISKRNIVSNFDFGTWEPIIVGPTKASTNFQINSSSDFDFGRWEDLIVGPKSSKDVINAVTTMNSFPAQAVSMKKAAGSVKARIVVNPSAVNENQSLASASH